MSRERCSAAHHSAWHPSLWDFMAGADVRGLSGNGVPEPRPVWMRGDPARDDDAMPPECATREVWIPSGQPFTSVFGWGRKDAEQLFASRVRGPCGPKQSLFWSFGTDVPCCQATKCKVRASIAAVDHAHARSAPWRHAPAALELGEALQTQTVKPAGWRWACRKGHDWVGSGLRCCTRSGLSPSGSSLRGHDGFSQADHDHIG